jgi:hypothetical protein
VLHFLDRFYHLACPLGSWIVSSLVVLWSTGCVSSPSDSKVVDSRRSYGSLLLPTGPCSCGVMDYSASAVFYFGGRFPNGGLFLACLLAVPLRTNSLLVRRLLYVRAFVSGSVGRLAAGRAPRRCICDLGFRLERMAGAKVYTAAREDPDLMSGRTPVHKVLTLCLLLVRGRESGRANVQYPALRVAVTAWTL